MHDPKGAHYMYGIGTPATRNDQMVGGLTKSVVRGFSLVLDGGTTLKGRTTCKGLARLLACPPEIRTTLNARLL